MLPDGSGFDLAPEMRGQSHTPIMFMTALNSAESRLTGFEIGANEVPAQAVSLEGVPAPRAARADHPAAAPAAAGRRVDDRLGRDGRRSRGPQREFLQVRDCRVLTMLVEAAPPRCRARDPRPGVGRREFPTQRTVDNAIVRLAPGARRHRRPMDSFGARNWISMGSQLEVMNAFRRALAGEPQRVPPIWLMRQAGRYHRPYQKLRSEQASRTCAVCPSSRPKWRWARSRISISTRRSCSAICCSRSKRSACRCPTPMGRRSSRPARRGPHRAFRSLDEASRALQFQAEHGVDASACHRQKGPDRFRRGPWTLFVYAMEGSHAGAMSVAKSSWHLYRAVRRADDAAARRGTSATTRGRRRRGDGARHRCRGIAAGIFPSRVAPDLVGFAQAFPRRLGYYAKAAHPAHIARRR